MNPEILHNVPTMVVDDIAHTAGELSELLNKVKKATSSQKNIVAGIFAAALTELERRGVLTDFQKEEDDAQADV